MKLEQIKKGNIPNHVAVILDGNGRWAKKKGCLENTDIKLAQKIS